MILLMILQLVKKFLDAQMGGIVPFLMLRGIKNTPLLDYLQSKRVHRNKDAMSYLLFSVLLFTNTKNTMHRCMLASVYNIRFSLVRMLMFQCNITNIPRKMII